MVCTEEFDEGLTGDSCVKLFTGGRMRPLSKLIFSALAVPLGLVALVLLYEAWEFMTLPTSERIERLIKTELPKGTDKGKVMDFLKSHEFKYGELHKVTAGEKSMSDYQEGHIKSQIDLIEYDTHGWRWTASWGIWATYVQVGFYFNKDEKLIDYTLVELAESL
jgi:hypothetical protein